MHIMQCTDSRHLRRNEVCTHASLGSRGITRSTWNSGLDGGKVPKPILLGKPHGFLKGDRSVQLDWVLNPGLLSMGSQDGFLPGLHIQNALHVPSLLSWLWAWGWRRNVVDKPWFLEIKEDAHQRYLLRRGRVWTEDPGSLHGVEVGGR